MAAGRFVTFHMSLRQLVLDSSAARVRYLERAQVAAQIVASFTRIANVPCSERYAAEVRESGGHSHGGGESMGRSEAAKSQQGDSAPDHVHADSTSESDHEHTEDNAHGDEGEPVAVAKAFHAALSSGDAAQVERFLAPDVLIMEAGNVERSLSEYAAHHLHADIKFMKHVIYEPGGKPWMPALCSHGWPAKRG